MTSSSLSRALAPPVRALHERGAPRKISAVETTRSPVPAPLSSRKRLSIAMAVAVALIVVLAFWDEEREQRAALADFADEQATLAVSVGADLASRIERARRDSVVLADPRSQGTPARAAIAAQYSEVSVVPATTPRPPSAPGDLPLSFGAADGLRVDLSMRASSFLEGISRVERPREVRVLIAPPGDDRLRDTDGARVDAPGIRGALGAGDPWIWLDRPHAAALGLPPRRAAVGLARFERGDGGPWGAVVVATAERLRDREQRATWRLVLGVVLASGLVISFGSVALREQRRELRLEQELAVAELARDRDQRLLSSSRSVTMGTLALGIAHELSTPLGIVSGRAEQLLERTSGDERSERCARAILEQTGRIERVVRGFLGLARSGKPELAQVAPSRVIEGAVGLVTHRFERADVTLAVAVDDELPFVRCDVAMLEQALANLLLNACDACPRGGHVTVGASSAGDRVVITVVDDGAGITEEAAARATEPFFTTKPAAHGSGLGLAIANEIVKLHLGALSIGPASPKGTRASIQLPALRRAPQGESAPLPVEEAAHAAS
ncbi:MAG: HAMP domain-containing sensor histidine kinase [Polyangiaceae bacterium]